VFFDLLPCKDNFAMTNPARMTIVERLTAAAAAGDEVLIAARR
jgi:hypothetical protein